jgi:hypothetical protein
MIRHVLSVALVAASLATAQASTPREDFENPALLEGAKVEISKLSADQLEAFIQYIAACKPTPSPSRDLECEHASMVVRIKTSRYPSLADVRDAVFVIDKIIPWNRPVSAKEGKDIDRRIDIFHELTKAAASRYEQLKALAP